MFGTNYFGGWYFGGRYFGKAGLTLPGYYYGNRYFGGSYFGARYFGKQGDTNPFIATQSTGLSMTSTVGLSSVTVSMSAPMNSAVTSGLAISGVVSINATPSLVLGDDFVAGTPLAFAATGTMTFSGVSVVMGFVPTSGRYFGGSYFGARYFGPYYWGTEVEFSTAVTTGLSMSGTMTSSATVTQSLDVAVTGLTFTGVLATPDPISIDTSGSSSSRDAGRPRKINRRGRYVAEFKGQEYYFETAEELESFVKAAKQSQTELPKKERESVKINLTPEFKEEAEEVVAVPPRLEKMPQTAALAFVRKIERELPKPVEYDDPEEDEILSWLI